MRHPILLAMSGSVASGKSSLARPLASRLGAMRIEGDRVRDDLLESSRDPVHEAHWARAFAPIFEEQVYAEMLRRADRELALGRAVVIDACFPRNAQRLRARSVARARGAAFLLVECLVPAAVVEARLAERDAAAGRAGWRSIHDALAERLEPISELAPDEHAATRSDIPLEEAVAAVLDAACLRGALAETRDAADIPRPDAVTFDCWNTLLYEEDWHTAHARRVDALGAMARESGAAVSRERAAVAFDAAWEQHMRLWAEGVATGAPEVARWALAGLGLRDPHPGLERLIALFQGASHSSRVLALEGARETLAALVERGIRCALVCDTGLTPGSVVRGHLARLGLLDALDVQAFSDEVGFPKPDARAFRAALTPLGIPPERAMHVGDLRRTDVAGARALGMTSVRIRACHDDDSELPDADRVVASHAELRQWLALDAR